MSKTITIPKDRDPFVVIVNGVEYKYPAGETVTVPDSVADVIEKYENAKPKPDPNPAPGGSVQSDWNQIDESAADFIKNKPFGDELVEIMPETEVVGENADGMFTYYLDVSLFTGDETQLKITFDGTEYDCQAHDLYGNTAFGNAGLMGEADTGESFLLIVSLEYGMAMLVLADANAHTISISKPGVNPIDSKYLLNNCLYTDYTYLYRNPDTSDVSNRITKNELLMYTKREKVVRIYTRNYEPDMGANEHTWKIASFVYCGNLFEYGYVCTLENRVIGDSSDLILSKLYTAEYTG
jgi:hypothetical protein